VVVGVTSSIGALRHLTEAKRLDALSRARAGKLYDLGRVGNCGRVQAAGANAMIFM
jgi:hypothetical protein